MTHTPTVTFNVGGEKFQVARSLFDIYPDCILAKAISERWQKDQDADEEIFFDRSPQLFHQVLEYLRNRKVHLPITVSKNAVLSELEYYCVDDVDEDAIDNSCRSTQLIPSWLKDSEQCMRDWDEERKHHRESEHAIEVAKYIFKRYRNHPQSSYFYWCTNFKHIDGNSFNWNKCNEYLAKVGLKARRIIEVYYEPLTESWILFKIW